MACSWNGDVMARNSPLSSSPWARLASGVAAGVMAGLDHAFPGLRRELVGSDDGDLPLGPHWHTIRRVVEQGQGASAHCAVASVDMAHRPHITPGVTVFLRDDHTGFYVDHFPKAQSRHLDLHPQVCLMALDTGAWFWLRALLFGRFAVPSGVRVYGTVGPLRPLTPADRAAVEGRMRSPWWSLRVRPLRADLTQVRDIRFTSFRRVRYPSMVQGVREH